MTKKFLIVGTDGLQEESLGFGSDEFIETSTGAPDAGKPVKLDSSGKLDSSLVDLTSVDHGSISGLGDDDHTQYIRVDGTRAFSGNQSIGGNKITSLSDPTSAQDAATKNYVDSVAAGLQLIGNVAAATTANIALSSMPASIDGYTLASGDRFLAKDQTDATENGIYVFNGVGVAATRSEDQDNSPLAEIVNGVLMPKTINGTVNAGNPYVITSQGSGTGGVHTIGVDDITFSIFSSPTELAAGDGIDSAQFDLHVVQVDLKASGGLKIDSSEIAVEPADFAGEGLVDDGSDNLAIDWSTAFTDAKAIKAEDLNSTANGEGASIVGIEDAAGKFDATNVEAALLELKVDLEQNGAEYTVGSAVSKGDVCFISSNDSVSPYSNVSQSHRALGLALSTESSGTVKVLANDTVLTGVITGATAGDPYYWNGTALVSTIPSGSGQYVWQAGVAKNATDLAVEVRFVKKNA